MFGIGVPEMLLVLVVALVVFGPNKLPELARTIGQAMGKFRAASHSFQRAVEREVRNIEPPASHPPVEQPAPPDSTEAGAPDAPTPPESPRTPPTSG
ncbi:MAG: twin-arginine translocase TatA/TatE family subunit [Leptospirillia bacterium]